IGLDVSLDATNLPAPSNLETLGRNEAAAKQAETDDVMSRPMDVSDSVASGTGDSVTSVDMDSGIENAQSDSINPDDYLPNYENDVNAVKESIEQAAKPKPKARNRKGNIVKRLYNRFFNEGAIALPHVETMIYLQQAAADNLNSNTEDNTANSTRNTTPKLTKADDDIQPFKN